MGCPNRYLSCDGGGNLRCMINWECLFCDPSAVRCPRGVKIAKCRCGINQTVRSSTGKSSITAKDVARAAAALQANDVYNQYPWGSSPMEHIVKEYGSALGAEPPTTCKDHPGDYGTNCAACEVDQESYQRWRLEQQKSGTET